MVRGLAIGEICKAVGMQCLFLIFSGGYRCSTFPKVAIKVFRNALFYVLFTLSVSQLVGCNKQQSAKERIYFTVDTVRFDTVMHSRVSSIRKVSLRNDGNRPVQLEQVRLEGSRVEAFHVVVDGVPYNEINGAAIPGGDSLIFVLSMYTEEYIPDAFEQLDVQMAVKVAGSTVSLPIRGWNAGWSELQPVIESDVEVPRGGIRYVQKQAQVLPTGSLILAPGVTLLFGDGAQLLVKGRFVARGEVEARVCLLPQRMEPYYMRKPGQWAGVIVEAESRGVELTHVDIRCAVVGLQVQGKPSGGAVKLENSRVLYSSQDGLQLTGGCDAQAIGTIFGQNYRHGVAVNGAKAELIHCTVCTESMPPHTQLGEGLWLDDGEGSAAVDIINTIIWGERGVEVGVQGGGKIGGRLSAKHSVLKMPQESVQNSRYFEGCTVEDPYLERRAQGLYSLGRSSSARGIGVPIGGPSVDLFGTPRSKESPDAGAVATPKP